MQDKNTGNNPAGVQKEKNIFDIYLTTQRKKKKLKTW